MNSRLLILTFTAVSAALAVPLQAQLEYPVDVTAHDSQVYIADRNLPGIWSVKEGQLSKLFVASKKFRTPLNAVRCVAIDGTGHVLAGDSSTREVYRFGDAEKPSGLTDGGIGIPMGIAATSSGDLMVADLELHRIWRVPAGGGKPELFVEVPAPRGICIDTKDGLWVVSHGTETQLLYVTGEKKIVPKVQGRPFRFPNDVVVDQNGTAYISDGYSKAVWKLPANGRPEKWVTGSPLKNPVGIALQDENVLVADPHAKAIFQIVPDGKITELSLAP